MALQQLAAIAVRRRLGWRLVLVAVATLAAGGCGRNRQSYRPVYTYPAPASAPCSNCGPSGTVTTQGSDGTVSSDVPLLPGSPSTDEPVVSTPAKPGAGAGRGAPVESTPRSRLSDEPPFDQSAGPASNPGDNGTPPAPPKPINPAQGPALQGPAAARSSPANDGDPDARTQLGTVNSLRVRRASSSQRLKPYIDEANANDLFYPNKADRPWKFIVLHQSASASGNYDQIDREHRKVLGYDGCGYHFVIGNGSGSNDGQIEVSQRWNNQKQGAHCRNARNHDADEYGIGIVLVGDFDQQPPTPRQIAATQALVSYLSQRYKIAPSGIRTHAHLAATPTVCPGKYFPSEAILTLSKEAVGQTAVHATWKVVRRGE